MCGEKTMTVHNVRTASKLKAFKSDTSALVSAAAAPCKDRLRVKKKDKRVLETAQRRGGENEAVGESVDPVQLASLDCMRCVNMKPTVDSDHRVCRWINVV